MSEIPISQSAFDIHSGLGDYDIPEFHELQKIGMAATLAVHIRGLGDIPYNVLRMAASYYFSIPTIALEFIVHLLGEIEFCSINKEGRTIKSITPDVPFFEDIYESLDEYSSSIGLTEHEQAALKILGSLQNQPQNLDSLKNYTGLETNVFDRCIAIGQQGGLIINKRVRRKDMLISPIYFAENLDTLTDLAARAGAKNMSRILELVKKAQGWPLSIIQCTKKIGDEELSDDDIEVLKVLATDGFLKPPQITRPDKTKENFVFTPVPKRARLNSGNREVYERAMALVTAMRKGQLLPEKIRIRSPRAILYTLQTDKQIGANTEAMHQYHNLAVLGVGRIEKISGGYAKFHLIDTRENVRAVEIAQQLLSSGAGQKIEVDPNARIALSQDETYMNTVLSGAEFRQRERPTPSQESSQQLDQMFLL